MKWIAKLLLSVKSPVVKKHARHRDQNEYEQQDLYDHVTYWGEILTKC